MEDFERMKRAAWGEEVLVFKLLIAAIAGMRLAAHVATISRTRTATTEDDLLEEHS